MLSATTTTMDVNDLQRVMKAPDKQSIAEGPATWTRILEDLTRDADYADLTRWSYQDVVETTSVRLVSRFELLRT
jgi:hypothetical protein